MTISKKKLRALAVLYLPRNVPGVLAAAAAVVKAMKCSRHFADPTPPLDRVRSTIDELRRAQTHTQLRTVGAVEARDEWLAALVSLLEQLRAYVQAVADLDPPHARAIIRSAGLWLRKEQERKPRGFHAKHGVDQGTVTLVAPAAARRASYDWEYSLDHARTWITLPSTLQSRTTLSGLPARSVVEVRYRAITKAGEGAWSGTIAIFVP